MTGKRQTYCQVSLSEKANETIAVCRKKLEDTGIKLSKAETIHLILSEISTTELAKIAEKRSARSKAKAKLMEIYENSALTEEDLEVMLARLGRE